METAGPQQLDVPSPSAVLAETVAKFFDNLGRTVWAASLMLLVGQIVMGVLWIGGVVYLTFQVERTRCHCNMIPRVEASGNIVVVEDPAKALAEKILREQGKLK